MKTRTVDTSEQIHDRRNCKNFFHKKTGIFQKKYALLQVRVSQLSARVPVGMVAGGLVVRSVGGSVGGGGVGSAMWHEPSTAFTRLSAGVSAKFTLLHNRQSLMSDSAPRPVLPPVSQFVNQHSSQHGIHRVVSRSVSKGYFTTQHTPLKIKPFSIIPSLVSDL